MPSKAIEREYYIENQSLHFSHQHIASIIVRDKSGELYQLTKKVLRLLNKGILQYQR